MSDDYIKAVFEAGGLFAQCLQRYEARKGQVDLSRAVDRAFGGKTHLLAEAPTGTGKSLAYSVPAIWHAVNGTVQRVVIATANIALQEQLVGKDLPFLQRTLPWRFRFALAKGRSNYVCKDRLDHAHEVMSKLQSPATVQFDRLVRWARDTSTGDVSELPEVPPWQLWSELSVSSEQCKGKRCGWFDQCFVNRAKQIVADAHIVVANYHLLFADLRVRSETDDTIGVLPHYNAVVLDEGHRAPDIARDFFGSKTSEFACRRLVADGMRAIRDARLEGMPVDLERALLGVEDTAVAFFGRCLTYRRSRDYKVRLRVPGEIDTTEMVTALNGFAKQFVALADDGGFQGDDRVAFRKLADRARDHASNLLRASEIGSPDTEVYYLEESAGKVPKCGVCINPIDVSDELRAGLFERCSTVIAMSATMTTVPGDFEHVARDLGADQTDELVVESPFDLQRQALLIVPTMPEPNDSAFRSEMQAAVVRVVGLAKGRTLGLFTSYRNLNLAAVALREAGLPYRLLVQGEGSRTALVDAFRQDVDSVLLGTESFWEGIDVPGEALSCLVIDRLPFLTPEDPILNAITERDPRGWFAKWSMPRALIAFRQGVGRLIRTVSDRGVVVCLDRRLHEKPYGRQFIRSLGGMRLSRSLDDVRSFLQVAQ